MPFPSVRSHAKSEEAATWFYKPNTERFQTAANKWPTLDGYIEYMKKELERTKLTLRVVVVTDTPCRAPSRVSPRI